MARKGTAMPMPSMTLEVTVVSGEAVRVPSGRPLCHGAYAVVRTATSSAPTRVDGDADCHGFPYWAEAVRVALPAGAPALDVEICCARGGGRPAEPVAAARSPSRTSPSGPQATCIASATACSTPGAAGSGAATASNITVRRLDGAPVGAAGKAAAVPAAGKAVGAAGPSGSGASCSGAAAGLGKPAAPAGAVMGYPLGC
ncbi:LOW QUALITY PROTEIN: protein FAM71B-like [Setaria italica]|uniref:LOW QUALITY PROTEIN: protein FAM71B-like n=1 Tax=Setaria italica TaxID=4555 RepID=UPI0006473D37|nr:LOW QUALITY PROTEIN: protein FAM71B-like [Setaria italica]